jgi:DNA-binding NtrC family response regulator
MPGMNGVEMAMQLKDRFPRCGVLLSSGRVGTWEILESASKKGYEFEPLAKPVHPKDLLAKLERALGRPIQSEGYLRGSDAMAS